MFSNIEAMIGLSVQLKEELTVKLETWDRKTTVIGQNMTRFSKFLLVYADFFKNFNETQHKLKLLLQTKESVREIERQLTVGPRIITFEDLMSKPFQRPLKYHLILRDYFSKTD
jgi:lipoate-protein ligase A